MKGEMACEYVSYAVFLFGAPSPSSYEKGCLTEEARRATLIPDDNF